MDLNFDFIFSRRSYRKLRLSQSRPLWLPEWRHYVWRSNDEVKNLNFCYYSNFIWNH